MRQEVRMRQELALQPQQILRSELIQMPLLELESRITSELEENPFLEELEEETQQDDSRDDAKLSDGEEQSSGESDDSPRSENEENPSVDWEDYQNDTEYWEYRPQTRVVPDDSNELPQPHIQSLSELLSNQLNLNFREESDIAIGAEILGNINHDGYLEISLEDVATRLGVSELRVESVHREILLFEPIGIASRDLRECLLVQLNNLEEQASVARGMIGDYWEDFINKRFEVLASKLDVTIEEIKDGYTVITKLNPKPGDGYFDERQNHVIPDLVVQKVGGEYVVVLNDGDIPNFKLNQAYREMYSHKRGGDKAVKDYLSRKLESARWFINAIHQRRMTMIRTMRAIVDKQIDFFERGAQFLKPMILADIAQEISMDISTISRVTNGKYVQTDWGVFELKYFFTEKMETEEGEDVSNRVIKNRLREIIKEEDKQKPLSDQQLTESLNKEGFHIQRRTVAKYREQLRIPVKRLRREI
ncbi:RNA polymerase factor sigma-54 [Calditrichota bacterium]